MQTAPLPAAVMVPSFLKFPDETLLIVYDFKRSCYECDYDYGGNCLGVAVAVAMLIADC